MILKVTRYANKRDALILIFRSICFQEFDESDMPRFETVMTIFSIKKSEVILLAIVIFLFSAVCTLQKKTEDKVQVKASESLNYLPSGAFLKGIALGYDEALADFLWVKTVGYFGAHAKTDRDFRWLIHMLKLTTELDPYYESPYEFAGVILPMELNMVDEGMAFLEKGIENIPKHNRRYWLQPFYLGFCYMIYKSNPLKAAQYMEEASKYPNSPKYLTLLVTRLYAEAKMPGVGIDLMEKVLKENRNDIKQVNFLRKSLDRRINELLVAQHIIILDEAVLEYIDVYHRRPDKLQDLVDGLILPFIPNEPFGGRYFLSMDGKDVLSSRSERKFVIFADKGRAQVNVSASEK